METQHSQSQHSGIKQEYSDDIITKQEQSNDDDISQNENEGNGNQGNSQHQPESTTNMMNSTNQQGGSDRPRKRYSVITQEVREKFIERVLSRQVTIKAAAKEFGIKFSTSKAILQTFKREGRTCKKKTRQRTNPRMVPTTITPEPLYGAGEEGNELDSNELESGADNASAADQQASSSKAGQKTGTESQVKALSNAGTGVRNTSGLVMNKMRYGKGLSINTNLNLRNNLKNIFPQRQAEVQYPNPFDSSRSAFGNNMMGINTRVGFQDIDWNVKNMEVQLKNIDVEILKQQARQKEMNPFTENDFNYHKYFSVADTI